MPSNADLTKEALSLAEKLGIEVETEGQNNAQLVDLVSDLRAKATDAEKKTAADDAQDKAAAAAEKTKAERLAGKKPEVKRPPYYMAPRKSLTSKKGILSGDTADEVKAEYLAGGEEALAAFVKSGHVLKG